VHSASFAFVLLWRRRARRCRSSLLCVVRSSMRRVLSPVAPVHYTACAEREGRDGREMEGPQKKGLGSSPPTRGTRTLAYGGVLTFQA
jgi:hypothetical protein